MPSSRVEGSSVTVREFDVAGQDGVDDFFIAHVGLAQADATYDAGSVRVFDMAPPLRVGNHSTAIQAHAIGSADLTEDEIRKIRVFIDQHSGEHAALSFLSRAEIIRRAPEMYCVLPHADPFCEADGRYARMRFSCVGFVFEAYKYARLNLLELQSLPLIDFAMISKAYPVQARLVQSGRLTLDSLGLKGSGPWPVLLCGYVLHSLGRSATEIRGKPYLPSTSDCTFGSA